MKKALALTIISAILICSNVVYAEEPPQDYATYDVFLDLPWGESSDIVKLFFGEPNSTSDFADGAIAQFSYIDVEFGQSKADRMLIHFANDKLVSVTYMFILPDKELFSLMSKAFIEELGTEPKVEIASDDKGMRVTETQEWTMPDETIIILSQDRNAVTLDISNSSPLQE